MCTMKLPIKFGIFLNFVLGISSEEYILGDVSMPKNILQIYYTTDETNGSMDWVSVCYSPQIIEAVANIACRQSNYVKAIRYNPGSQSNNRPYSFTHIKCPTVSDYEKYGELHILRCFLEGPILTPNNCQPISVECDLSERLTQNPYEGQVSLEYTETGTLADGELKVFLGGKWTGICYNDNFPPYVADSACRQKGYTGCSSIDQRIDTGKSLLLEFSSYDCVQSSFACFSHCIAEILYDFKVCPDKIFLKCEFNTSVMLSNSSGSSSQCALTSTHTCNNNSSKYHTWLVVVAVILAVIVLFVSLFICCYCFKFCKRNVNRERAPPMRPLYNALNEGQDDDREILNNDRV